uniref:Uncharacterized protein n=1 Tax=Octopus bimaculoides TaxID=37653 RepID=A0A0L8IFK9_OCTBM
MTIHRRDPTTAQHGVFCLLRFRPGPERPSLDNLVLMSSLSSTILMPSLARTPNRHRRPTSRTPILKPANQPRLRVAGLQEHTATQYLSSMTYIPPQYLWIICVILMLQ